MLPELITFFSSMLPFTELRGAIPLAITTLGLTPREAFFWGVLGNIIPNFFILWLLGPISAFLMKKSKLCDKFFTKLFDKTRKKYHKKFEKYGYIFLLIFVAVPLPGSGGWTGTLIAFLFGASYWKAIGAISLGIICAGILVTLGFESIVKIAELYFASSL